MNFKLRPWEITDLENLVLYANNPAIAQNLMDRFPHPYTEDSGRKFLQMAIEPKPANVLCIDIDGAASGGIGLHIGEDIYRKNAELGYWLAEPFWGNGIISKMIPEMVKYGFENFDITRIFARPFGTNKASQRVLEKAGFVLEAKLEKTFFKNGAFQDELIYAIRRS